MNPILKVCVEGEPVSKARPRLGRGGHTYTPRETTEAEQVIGLMIKTAMGRSGMSVDADSEFILNIEFYTAKKRRKDIDNCLKAVMDAGNKILYKDDSQVCGVWTRSYVLSDAPRTEIQVYRVVPDAKKRQVAGP